MDACELLCLTSVCSVVGKLRELQALWSRSHDACVLWLEVLLTKPGKAKEAMLGVKWCLCFEFFPPGFGEQP